MVTGILMYAVIVLGAFALDAWTTVGHAKDDDRWRAAATAEADEMDVNGL